VTHLPELGQWAFSNGVFHEHEVPPIWLAALEYLCGQIEIAMWNATQERYRIGSNCAEEFLAGVFEMRDYCWCDGDRLGHEVGCPPNFRWRDVEINWYKHLGRGMSANVELSPESAQQMLAECVPAAVARAAQEELQ
jgi:hypothetical protein